MNALTRLNLLVKIIKSKIINIYKHTNLNDAFNISIKRIVSVRV